MNPIRLLACASVFLAGSVAFGQSSSFPLIMKMDSAYLNGDVGAALGGLAFPQYKVAVSGLAHLAERLKGMDVHVRVNITRDSLTFTPNDVMDAITMKGLKTIQFPTADVRGVYELTDAHGFRELALVTKSGALFFHLDGDSIFLLFSDYSKTTTELRDALLRACPHAPLHQERE
jgi:hypothetical protein